MFGFLDNAARVQDFRRDLVICRKGIFQRIETDLDPLFLENVREATLRQTTMQGHLAAFKSGLRRITGTRLLAFVTTARRLAQTRAGTAAETLFLVRRALGWM